MRIHNQKTRNDPFTRARSCRAVLATLLASCTPEPGAISATIAGTEPAESTSGGDGSTSTGTPTTSGTGSSDGESTSAPRCGDGVLDPGETCDDGNTVNGDGCNRDCTPSGALLWGWRSKLAKGDAFHDVAITADGGILAGGWQAAEGALPGLDRWLVRFSADGALIWSRIDEQTMSSDIRGLAVHDDRIYAAGSIRSDTYRQLWVGRHDLEGAPGWQDVVASEFGDVYATGVAATPEGDVVVVGLATLEGGDAELWTRRYGADGAVQWTAGRPVHDKAFYAQGPGISASAQQIVVGFYTEPSLDELLLAYAPLDGAPLFDRPRPRHQGPIYGVTHDPAGDILVTGWAKNISSTVRRFGADGTPLWSSFDCAGNAGRAIAIDSQGDVVVMGDVPGATQLDLHLCKFSAQGQLRWDRSLDGGAGLDFGRGVAILPDDRIVAVGEVFQAGEANYDAIIAVYSP